MSKNTAKFLTFSTIVLISIIGFITGSNLPADMAMAVLPMALALTMFAAGGVMVELEGILLAKASAAALFTLAVLTGLVGGSFTLSVTLVIAMWITNDIINKQYAH